MVKGHYRTTKVKSKRAKKTKGASLTRAWVDGHKRKKPRRRR